MRGFGIHSIQHVLIGKALFNLLVSTMYSTYCMTCVHIEPHTYTSDRVFSRYIKSLLIKYFEIENQQIKHVFYSRLFRSCF